MPILPRDFGIIIVVFIFIVLVVTAISFCSSFLLS